MRNRTYFISIIAAVYIIFGFSQLWDIQFDLTPDKRYSISSEAKEIVRSIEQTLTITVLLEGHVPVSFSQLKDFVDNYLSELRRSNHNIELIFKDPNEGNAQELRQFRSFLNDMGITPLTRRVSNKEDINQSVIYPFISIHDQNRIVFLDLLEAKQSNQTEEEALLIAQSRFEGKLLKSLRGFKSATKPMIGFTGHQYKLISEGLRRNYKEFDPFKLIALNSPTNSFEYLDSLSGLVVLVKGNNLARSQQLLIDQAFMRDIPIICLVDKYSASLDSLRQNGEYWASPFESSFDDMLFKWGLKVNRDLVMDLRASKIPQVTGNAGGGAKTDLLDYPYHILASPDENKIITNLSSDLLFKFASSIDTLQFSFDVHKEVLISSSRYSKLQHELVRLNFDFLRVQPNTAEYDAGAQILAIDCKGAFDSYFANRLHESDQKELGNAGISFKAHTDSSRIVLISDLDLIEPMIGQGGGYFPPAYNVWDKNQYIANIQLLANIFESVSFGDQLLSKSKKSLAISILDKNKYQESKISIASISILLPVLVFSIFSLITAFWRKRRYVQAYNQEKS